MRYAIILMLLVCCPLAHSDSDSTQRQLMCLLITLYGEARGESMDGKYAAAWVIRNRVESSRFPGDVCTVVTQPNQFESITSIPDLQQHIHNAENGIFSLPPFKFQRNYEKLYLVAYQVLYNIYPDPTNGATYFWSPKLQRALGRPAPRWTRKYQVVANFGDHQYHKP